MSTMRPRFVQTDFRKASRSDPRKQCVEVARGAGWVELRDSKTVFGAAEDRRLVFTAEEFDAYLSGVRAGRSVDLCLEILPRADGMFVFRRARSGAVGLEFTEGEVAAFLDGVAKGEFDSVAYAA